MPQHRDHSQRITSLHTSAPNRYLQPRFQREGRYSYGVFCILGHPTSIVAEVRGQYVFKKGDVQFHH